MTKYNAYVLAFVLLYVSVLIGCGGSPSSVQPVNTNGGGGQPIFSFLQDAPSDNVIAFRIDATDATLQTTTGKNVSIADGVEHLELRHLQLAPTLLFQSSNTPVRNYTSLTLTFANPELTLRDAHGKISRLNSSTTPSVLLTKDTVTIPISMSVDRPLGFMFDFDIRQSITTDPNGNYVVQPVIIPSLVPLPDSIPALEGVLGQIVSVSPAAPSIDVQLVGHTAAIHVVANTATLVDATIGQFQNLKVGQVVQFSAELQQDGTFLATKIGTGVTNSALGYSGVVNSIQQSTSGGLVTLVLQD